MTKRAEKMLRLMDRAVTEWHIAVVGREKGRVIKRHLAKFRRDVRPCLPHARSGAPYTSREYDFGFDCMEVSVYRG